MLRDGFLRFCNDPEIACCKAERELEQLRTENASLREQLAESQRRKKGRCGMTIDRACEILDPEHREHYDSIETVNEACRMAISALRAQEKEPCGWCSYFAEEIQSFYVSEYGDDKQHYEFCPMCGRKLPQPLEENN